MKGYSLDITKVLENLVKGAPDADVKDIKERITTIVSIVENLCNDRRTDIDKVKNIEAFRNECTAQVIALALLKRTFVEADATGNAAKVAELARDGRFFWTELH